LPVKALMNLLNLFVHSEPGAAKLPPKGPSERDSRALGGIEIRAQSEDKSDLIRTVASGLRRQVKHVFGPLACCSIEQRRFQRMVFASAEMTCPSLIRVNCHAQFFPRPNGARHRGRRARRASARSGLGGGNISILTRENIWSHASGSDRGLP
jgi:hypothetical protein